MAGSFDTENITAMLILKSNNLTEQLHQLINAKKTGSPEELAQTLGIPKRQVFVLIDELKSIGLPVQYSRSNKTYCYSGFMRFNMKLEIDDVKVLSLTTG